MVIMMGENLDVWRSQFDFGEIAIAMIVFCQGAASSIAIAPSHKPHQ